MIATRAEPIAPTREGFAQSHHDARGRKLNVILLLTDVLNDGAATIVLKGSHQLLYIRTLHDAFQVNCMTKRDHLWTHEIPLATLAAPHPAQQTLRHRANLRPLRHPSTPRRQSPRTNSSIRKYP
ncbi:MAG: hypothetical protein O3B24_05515 [Verrucomicrobia bacterium]|nr:hypothetical protein [Verrucomicrobiota bacterium]